MTKKIYYWGNSGGDALYWMSSPYKNEYGSWQSFSWGKPEIIKNHHKFFESIANLKGIERDDAFKREAIKNIRDHPKKYLLNWISNIERLLFGFPTSHHLQKTRFMFIPIMFIVVLSVLLLYPTIKFIKNIPFEIILLLIFASIYFFISSLVSAGMRQFHMLIPIIGLWLGYMFNNVIHIDYSVKNKL